MRHLLLAILCTSAFVMAEEGGAGANGEPGTPAVAPTVQSQQPQPHLALKAGMEPLTVVGICGLDCFVEYAAPLLTLTYHKDGEWVAVVFLDSKLISVQRGSTRKEN